MRRTTVAVIALVVGLSALLTGIGVWFERLPPAFRPRASEARPSVAAPLLPASTTSALSPPAVPVPQLARGPASLASTTHADLDEPGLMAQLRRLATEDPGRAVELAREGNRRFPDGADAPERSSILIHSLAAQGQSSEARGEAEEMVNHYPDSKWVREIEAFTGAHRHVGRNLRLNDDGKLEYY